MQLLQIGICYTIFLGLSPFAMCEVGYREHQYEVYVDLLAKRHNFHQKEEHSSQMKA